MEAASVITVMVATGSIAAAAHIIRIHQVTPMYTSIQYMVPWAHASVHCKPEM